MAIKTRFISFIWGFAEASFFFLVPDIWLTRIALKNPKEAYLNIIMATFGAIFGGIIMYYIGAYAFENGQEFLSHIPAISDDMIKNTGASIQSGNLLNTMLAGSLNGIPYKIYAVWAGHLSLSFPAFVFVTIIVRTLRFVLSTTTAYLLNIYLKKFLKNRTILGIHAIFWLCLYVYYFYKFNFFNA